MPYRAILFDMDGTLVPMETDAFVKYYFKYLAAALCPLGIEPQPLFDTVWAGTGAMVKNDGRCTNEEVFWSVFTARTGLDAAPFMQAANAFYGEGFHKARAATGPNPLAVEAVRLAHEKAPVVVLATNPLFPMVGQKTRMSWVGLTPEDFALVTSYESDSYCKPNPMYYQTICDRIGVEPEDCLMIGNDETEDMLAARALGMDTYLVTDCLIPAKDGVYDGPRGTFAELIDHLKAL